MKKIIRLSWFVLFLFGMVVFDLGPIQVPDGIDKVYHFIGFSIFTVLSISLFAAFFDKKWLNAFLVFLLIFGGAIAGITEFVQKVLSSTRECSYEDWLANLFGIVFVTLFVYLVNSKQESKIELFEEKFDLENIS